MTEIVVNVVEVNRVRHVALEGLVLALSAALESPEPNATRTGDVQLERARLLLRSLRGLLAQPLPERAMSSSAGIPVELEAPRHELEQLADELDALAIDAYGARSDGLGEAAGIVRARAAAR